MKTYPEGTRRWAIRSHDANGVECWLTLTETGRVDPIPHLREMARCALWTAGLHRKAAETNVATAARTRSARQQGEPQPGEWLESAERFLKVAMQHRHAGLALLRAVVEIRRLRAQTSRAHLP